MEDDESVASSSTRHLNLGNGHNQASALQLFVNAKKKISDIYHNIGQYVLEADDFLGDISRSVDCVGVVSEENIKVVHAFKEKINGITKILARDHMKVIFVGRTSNGKSTAVNAMLRDNVLPNGIGHTTHCFIQVEGSDNDDGYLLIEDTGSLQNIKDIKQLASALSSVRLSENALIRILWPKEKCWLLREDVVLVDSPGIDVTEDLDTLIDKFCLDADVFVLVANAESTLTLTEKKLFHKVSSRLSSPNIFILQNRWDFSDKEEDKDEVKQQHIDRNTEFLSEELKVTDKETARDRVFFVSAKEALASRLSCDEGITTQGFQARLLEFANFEKEFELCISQSAVKTKFEQHSKSAHLINSELRTIMDEAYTKSLSLHDDRVLLRSAKSEKLRQLDEYLDDIKEKKNTEMEELKRKVSSALDSEIETLPQLVEKFEETFNPDPELLKIYKEKLDAHVEQHLGRNLQAKCSSLFAQAVENIQREMTDSLAAILPEEVQQQRTNIIPERDSFVCRKLWAGFKEDLEFRSSRLSQFFAYITSNPYVQVAGSAATNGVASTVAGWKGVLVSDAAVHGAYNIFKYLKGHEKIFLLFKDQYVKYVSGKLHDSKDEICSNCSDQVENQLNSTVPNLLDQAEHTKAQLETEIKEVDKGLSIIKEISIRAKTLRDKADSFDGELQEFAAHFLSHSGL